MYSYRRGGDKISVVRGSCSYCVVYGSIAVVGIGDKRFRVTGGKKKKRPFRTCRLTRAFLPVDGPNEHVDGCGGVGVTPTIIRKTLRTGQPLRGNRAAKHDDDNNDNKVAVSYAISTCDLTFVLDQSTSRTNEDCQ